MHENEIATIVVAAAFRVHGELGPRLLETVYEAALQLELAEAGLTVQRQHPVPVVYKSLKLAQGFRADLIVCGKVIVEIKAQDAVPPVAYKILLTYLRFADMRLRLLINFNNETAFPPRSAPRSPRETQTTKARTLLRSNQHEDVSTLIYW